MNQYLSDKIKLLSLILIVFVLYIHSGFKVQGFYLNSFIQDLVSNKIGRLAVPVFFMISGYLYFLKTEIGLYVIRVKIKKRFTSIFLPYIYSCLLFVLTFAGIQSLPGASNYINWDFLSLFDKPLLSFIKNIFWMMDDGNSPIAFHLWFLRDLILIIIISPLIYIMIKNLKWLGILILFFMILLNVEIYPISLLSSIGWFSIGGGISISKSKIIFKKVKWGYLIFIGYLFVSYIIDVLPDIYLKYFDELLIVFGSIGVWYLYDALIGPKFVLKKFPFIDLVCQFTFFIYLIHEPFINIIRKLIVLFVGKTSLGYLISYILSPIIFVMFAVLIGMFLRKYLPKMYSNFVGGRV
ncbi:acyltransferase family protein [Lutibacter holmesii]|uniref:Acyltransferase family protein n=1 Tax=Lutibacter holmesii TaxID=1137985 RepID=A0ABW3WRC5_9FLAO